MAEWYSVVSGDEPLDQGDLLEGCPVVRWKPATELIANDGGDLTTHVEKVRMDAIVLTQACDLEKGSVTNVVLCVANTATRYKKAWEQSEISRRLARDPKASSIISHRHWTGHLEEIRTHRIHGLYLLDAQGGPLATEHRIVDFREVMTAPRSFLENWLKVRGEQRLRIKPLYREKLSQHFGQFFQRIGLPEEIQKFA